MELQIAHLKTNDPLLEHVIDAVGPLSCHTETDGFAFLVEAVIGQMLSAKAADTIAKRVRTLLTEELTPQKLAETDEQEVRRCGLSGRKARTILGLASYLCTHEEALSQLVTLSDEQCMKELTRHKGIGAWTAKMYLIFVLGRADILPYEDGALRQAFFSVYGTDKEEAIKQRGALWSPYCSIACRYLYRYLDLGLTRGPGQESASAQGAPRLGSS